MSNESIPRIDWIEPTAGMLPPQPMRSAFLSKTSSSALHAEVSQCDPVGIAIAGLHPWLSISTVQSGFAFLVKNFLMLSRIATGSCPELQSPSKVGLPVNVYRESASAKNPDFTIRS